MSARRTCCQHVSGVIYVGNNNHGMYATCAACHCGEVVVPNFGLAVANRVIPEESAGTAHQAYIQSLLEVTYAHERGEKHGTICKRIRRLFVCNGTHW